MLSTPVRPVLLAAPPASSGALASHVRLTASTVDPRAATVELEPAISDDDWMRFALASGLWI